MQNKQNFQNVIFLSTVDIELTTLCLWQWWFIHMTSDELLELKIYKAMLFYKASVYSFRRFTSRPFLKIYFSFSMHLLPRMNVMLYLIWTLPV